MELIKILLTSILSAVSLFIVIKFSGHKQLSELDPFDFVSSITIGSIAAELATDLEKPYKPLIALIVWFLISIILSFCERKFPRSRKFICGTPTILFYNGRFYTENMKKSKLDLSEFLLMCRQAGYFDLAEIRMAVFEYNGKISILPTEMARPVNATDIGVIPKRDDIFTEIIMDGRILHDNIKRSGLDLNWLENNLATQGINDAKSVFLAVCDSDKKLSVYKYRS